MAWDSTPWFTGGGAEHSAEVARLLAYAATSGVSGIVSPADLKVTPLDVPGGAVRVMPGAAIILNSYAGGGQQSYVARNASATDVPITPTGSASGRSDLVVVRIDDPQYQGWPPEDPNVYEYVRTEVISGVAAGTTSVESLGLSYPAVAIARIDIPASTGTITAAMIKNLRTLSMPRRQRFTLMHGPTPEQPLNATGGTKWPDFKPMVAIPAWATHVTVLGHLASMGHRNGNTTGTLAVVIGGATLATQARSANAPFDLDAAVTSGQRHTFIVGGSSPVPPSIRGTTQELRFEGRLDSGPGYLVTVGGTQVIFDIEFLEQAV